MKKLIYPILFLTLFSFCKDDEDSSQGWLIPFDQVKDGGPGKDGIPSIDQPTFFTEPNEAYYLKGNDLIIGYVHEGEARAYPHKILDWHEIVNDEYSNHAMSIIYCPLTGTATAWERTKNSIGLLNSYGVSGLLYNNNLIPYDRETDSNWSQMGLQCVNGELIGDSPVVNQLIETTWSTWLKMYPNTKVLSIHTGFSRNYDEYPYGDFKSSSWLPFHLADVDHRLHPKQRVLGVISDGKVKAYRFSSFNEVDNRILTDLAHDKNIILVGSLEQNFIISFEEKSIGGTVLTFSTSSKYYVDGIFTSNIIMEDQFGNEWDIFGKAVSGPNAGKKLIPTTSFIGYWFPWASFYPDPEIYNY